MYRNLNQEASFHSNYGYTPASRTTTSQAAATFTGFDGEDKEDEENDGLIQEPTPHYPYSHVPPPEGEYDGEESEENPRTAVPKHQTRQEGHWEDSGAEQETPLQGEQDEIYNSLVYQINADGTINIDDYDEYEEVNKVFGTDFRGDAASPENIEDEDIFSEDLFPDNSFPTESQRQPPKEGTGTTSARSKTAPRKPKALPPGNDPKALQEGEIKMRNYIDYQSRRPPAKRPEYRAIYEEHLKRQKLPPIPLLEEYRNAYKTDPPLQIIEKYDAMVKEAKKVKLPGSRSLKLYKDLYIGSQKPPSAKNTNPKSRPKKSSASTKRVPDPGPENLPPSKRPRHREMTPDLQPENFSSPKLSCYREKTPDLSQADLLCSDAAASPDSLNRSLVRRREQEGLNSKDSEVRMAYTLKVSSAVGIADAVKYLNRHFQREVAIQRGWKPTVCDTIVQKPLYHDPFPQTTCLTTGL
jgi:hypothetical protein